MKNLTSERAVIIYCDFDDGTCKLAGTGTEIAAGVVLTARHVVIHNDRSASGIEIGHWRGDGSIARDKDVSIQWSDPTLDLAVLTRPGAMVASGGKPEPSVVTFGSEAVSAGTFLAGHGYPLVSDRSDAPYPLPIQGAAGDELPGGIVQIPKLEIKPSETWTAGKTPNEIDAALKGASGAGLWSNGSLVAVLLGRDKNTDVYETRSLSAALSTNVDLKNFIDGFRGARPLDETADSVTAPLDCLAFPDSQGSAGRRQFPENIAMRIGVDRTRLIAVVDGIDPYALLANLMELERILIAADPDGKFGRRKWVLTERDARSPEFKSWDAIGTIWPVPLELSVDALAGAIRTAFPEASTKGRGCAPRAGNVLVAVLQERQEFGQILAQTVEKATMAAPGTHVGGWSLRRYRQLETALSEAEADDPALAELSLSGLERKAFSALHRSQNVMLREKALVELENLAPSLPPHLKALFDWVAKGKGRDDEAFFVSAGNYALYAATLSGLVSGDFASPDARQRGAKIVRLSGSNRELGHVLAALPACSEVLEALMEGNPWCRAAVGLVTADELAGPSPPGLGYPLDQWRNDRPLVT